MTLQADIRAQAESLARSLPEPDLKFGAAQTLYAGAAGRRRAGSGEDFWQYRRYAQTDGADRVDWRRSARGDDLYVRETELETARTIYFWTDPSPGFHWSGAPERETKADRANTLLLALASLLSRAGERVGCLAQESRPAFGRGAAGAVERGLFGPLPDTPVPPRGKGAAILASDFYGSLDDIQAWLKPLQDRCRHGILLAISDPVELDFPFEGRTRLRRPSDTGSVLLGRAETLRDDYLDRLAKHQAALEDAAAAAGWAVVRDTSGTPIKPAAARLLDALNGLGAAK